MMATAFLGYVLPYGQMSHWGMLTSLNVIIIKPQIKPDIKFMAMFMGFFDGDGYFDIGEQKQYNKGNTQPKSTIRMRLATNVHIRDLPLLEYFSKVLGVGNISYMSTHSNQVRIIFSKRDLVKVILPLIKEYKLKFLTSHRVRQFLLLNYILDNNIVH
jgi:hypothetical protein